MAREDEFETEMDEEAEGLEPEVVESPIDRLRPGSELHTRTLERLVKKLNASERAMSDFHNRWQVAERRFMAYINMQDFEKLLEQTNKVGDPPSAVSIVVPYAYATAWTVVTYLVHTFTGRKPILQVGAYTSESVKAAQHMETILQYQADRTKLVRRIFQWMMDGQIYSVGVIRTLWSVEKARRSTWVSDSPMGAAAPGLAVGPLRTQREKVIYEGNECTSIDPFSFFPDPRVPMEEVNRRGEFVFWRNYEGRHSLKKAEQDGQLRWVNDIGDLAERRNGEAAGSNRNLMSRGEAHAGLARDADLKNYIQVDQGTVEIIPSEWGLGDSDRVEKWLFTIGNKKQIIQAEPLDYDHNRHPISVIEPNSTGYSFGQSSLVDMLGPIQDVLSWFVNSHMHNVRASINNMFLVDPSAVEMQDLTKPGPGKIIRLKSSAIGRDVRSVFQQLQVADVTRGHMSDMQAFMRIGDVLSAVNDNLRGVQESGGRKTATEVRTSGESGASRLAALARLVSAQGVTDLAEQMSLNTQQLMTMEFFLQVVGQEGLEGPVPINPQSVAGDFFYPIHDGTLPLDRVALLEVWKEVFMAVAGSPGLSARFDLVGIFEYLAELGGAKNLKEFKLQAQVAPPGVDPAQLAGGGPPVAMPGVNPGSIPGATF